MSSVVALTTVLDRTPTPTLALRLARLEVEGLLRKLARGLGIGRPAPLTLDELAIPDSKLAQAATELVESCEPPYLLHHSVRSYLFGAAVGTHLAWRFDREVLYLAAVMHDIGLVEPYDDEGSFELNGARVARDFLATQGAETERADRVHEAIALHSAVGVAGRNSDELALLHFGAGVDVIGYRVEDVAPATRAAITTAWPRLGFKHAFTRVLEDQVTRKPRCHIAGHMGLGFARKVAAAPFPE